MKRGFTLLEIIIVIIIIGILATLGLTQYGRVVERSRGAEARSILGTMRTQAAAFRLEHGNFTGFTVANLGVGGTASDIPTACAATHFFSYGTATTCAGTACTFTATRCEGAAGKQPGAPAGSGWTLVLTSDYATGADTWSGTGGY